jgi:hypothetical protein
MKRTIWLGVLLGAVACSDGGAPPAANDQAELGAAAPVPVRTLITISGNPSLVLRVAIGDKGLYIAHPDDTGKNVLEAFDLGTGARIGAVDAFAPEIAATSDGVAWADRGAIWVADASLGGAHTVTTDPIVPTALAIDGRFVYAAESTGGAAPGDTFGLRRFARAGGDGATLLTGFGTIVALHAGKDHVFAIDQRTSHLEDFTFPYLSSTLISLASDGTSRSIAATGQAIGNVTAPISSSAQGFALANIPPLAIYDPAQSAPIALLQAPTQSLFVDDAEHVSGSFAGSGCTDVKTDGRSLYCIDMTDGKFSVVVSAPNGTSVRRIPIQHLASAFVPLLLGVRNNRLFFLEVAADGKRVVAIAGTT